MNLIEWGCDLPMGCVGLKRNALSKFIPLAFSFSQVNTLNQPLQKLYIDSEIDEQLM